jgi:DNA invertase Pin-like site-specific DNA recombinase
MSQNEPRRVVGYARVSAEDQVAHGQVDALRQVGVTEEVVEQASGVGERPLLDSLVASLGAGDTLVATEVSRLGRTTAEILLLADSLQKRGAHLRILNLGIDTATPAGGLVLTMMAGLAKFERQVLRERQRRGIDAARLRGTHLGRPPLLGKSHAQVAIGRLITGETVAAIAREWRVSERTLSRLVNRHRGDGPPPTLPGGRGKKKRRGQLVAEVELAAETIRRDEWEQREENPHDERV